MPVRVGICLVVARMVVLCSGVSRVGLKGGFQKSQI